MSNNRVQPIDKILFYSLLKGMNQQTPEPDLPTYCPNPSACSKIIKNETHNNDSKYNSTKFFITHFTTQNLKLQSMIFLFLS